MTVLIAGFLRTIVAYMFPVSFMMSRIHNPFFSIVRLPVRSTRGWEIEDTPMYRVRVEFAVTALRVSSASSATEIEMDAHTVAARIEDIHEVLIIDY